MRLRVVGLLVLGIALSLKCLGQGIVDQTFIDPEDSVFLWGPVSIDGFESQLDLGSQFPDFETISIENEIISLDDIYETAIANQKVPVIIFGRPSCVLMRAGYERVVLPLKEVLGGVIDFYHLANSVEAHATNGYQTPYFDVFQGQPYPAPQIPSENVNFEFEQPFLGSDLIEKSAEFIDKMVETGVGSIEDFEDITVLIDNPQGGFTETFRGPAMMWVLNPFSGEVEYEESSFFCTRAPTQPCEWDIIQISNAITTLLNQFQTVGITRTVTSESLVELEYFNLLGQTGANTDGFQFLYNPTTKKKYVRLVQ